MIIISQDKKSVYNFDNVKSIDILGNEVYIIDDILSDIGVKIAEYETEVRAKEVLRNIIDLYSEYGLDGNLNVKLYPKIFEMPKE